MKVPNKIYAYIPDDDYVGTCSTKKGEPHEYVNTAYIRKDLVSEYLSKRLKDLWNSSSAMDDHDDYYRNPVVKELKNIVKLIAD